MIVAFIIGFLFLFALGEFLMIVMLIDELKQIHDEAFDPEWMDKEKWRHSR